MIPSVFKILLFEKALYLPPPPPPPYGDEAQFTDGSYVRFTDDIIKEYA